MQTRLTVILQRDERAALAQLAERERRDPRAQAAVLIHEALKQLNLLKTDNEGGRKDLNSERKG